MPLRPWTKLASLFEPSLRPAVTETNSWRSLLSPLLVALGLTFAVMSSPHLPVGPDGDSSWGNVLDHSYQKNLQFGRDLTFTYGPFGFFLTPYFSIHQHTARIFIPAVLAFVVSAGVCLSAWQLRLAWRVLLIGTFGFVCSNLDYGSDGLVEIGFLSWGPICLTDNSRRLPFYLMTFVFLSVFCAFAKMTFLYLAFATVCFISCELLMRKRVWLALSLVTGFATVFLAVWVALGQSITFLPAFLINGFTLARGYAQTMGLEAVPIWKWRGAATFLLAQLALLVLATTFLKQETTIRRRGFLITAWMLILNFMVWKHAFVLAEYFHTVLLFSFAPVLVLMLEVIPAPPGTARGWGRALAMGCWILGLLTLQSMAVTLARPNLALQPFRNWQENFRRVFFPMDNFRRMQAMQAASEREQELPALGEIVRDHTVDVFGSLQSFALANKFNYQQRPVFQSYAACNARLMRLNEDFYLSTARPEYVLFSLHPLLRRFPPLEDAFVLRHLLINYEPVANEGPFLLLKANSNAMPNLRLLREGTIGIGEKLELGEFASSNLWIELQAHQSIWGHARELLYQPSKLRLAAWSQDGKTRLSRLQAPAPMLEAGFFASPLLLNNDDVLNLYTANSTVRPAAYSLETAPGETAYWQQSVQYHIYRIENRIGKNSQP